MAIDKVNILAIGAHPDDVELACVGTLLRHSALGYTFGLLDLTRGELGTRGNADLRTMEAMSSAEKMRAAFRIQLTLPDGFLHPDDPEQLLPVISAIRSIRPDIILCNAIADRHPDHGNGGALVVKAAYLSGLPKIVTQSPVESNQQPWRPRAVYHYIQDRWRDPDFVVDITDHMQEKLTLIGTFQSQFYDPSTQEPETPISGKDFFAFIESRARDMGRPAGYTFAEGFNVARYPGVSDLFSLH